MTGQKPLPKDLIEYLKWAPTPFIHDAMVLCHIDSRSTHLAEIYPLSHWLPPSYFPDENKHIAGPAVTMKMVPARFGPTSYAKKAPYLHTVIVEDCKPGEVLVIDGEGRTDSGCLGNLSHQTAVRSGVEAFVIDGGCRDVTVIRQQGLPVFCKGITPVAYIQYHEVQGYNVPINCGGAEVHPGDIIVGDDNGVIVLPRDNVEEIIKVAKEAIATYEEAMVNDIKQGKSWRELYRVRHTPKWELAERVRKKLKTSK